MGSPDGYNGTLAAPVARPQVWMRSMIITIDGPAGSGKSTAAKALARSFSLRYLDTGSTYRALTLCALRAGVNLADPAAVTGCARAAELALRLEGGEVRVILNGRDVSGEIRGPEIAANTHYIASVPEVREVLVELQRRTARRWGGVVTEGRDQGSVVFPDADVKFFLVSDPAERARRRCQEYRAAGETVDYQQVLTAIETRDRRDAGRAAAPLVKPVGAISVDNTTWPPERTAAVLTAHVEALRPRSYPNPALGHWRFEDGVQTPNPLYRGFRKLFQIHFAALWRTRVFNRHFEPTSGPAVYICNHQSFLDPIVMSMALRRPMNYMARDSLFRTPGFGRLIRALNAFPVRRGAADTAALKEALRRIKAGGQVVVFPEGTRTRDGRIGKFLSGVALLARRSGAATVPVLIDGAFECWPRSQKLPHLGEIVVQYGLPLPADQTAGLSSDTLVNRVRDQLIAIQRTVRRRLNRPPITY